MKIRLTPEKQMLFTFVFFLSASLIAFVSRYFDALVVPSAVLLLLAALVVSVSLKKIVRSENSPERLPTVVRYLKIPDESFPVYVRRADSFHLEVFHKVAQLTEIAKPLSPENQISIAKHLRTYQEFKPHPKLEQYFHKLIKTLSESDLTIEAKSELRETLRFQLSEPFKAQIQSLLEDRASTNLPK